ncbi:MAG: choice-of-anchor L domain-containing protein [Nannocystis sp.]|nr:choice-of-anchor L domain-containing protein [Nannocystis sp.]
MRYQKSGLVAACLVAPLLLGCSDDGGVASGDTVNPTATNPTVATMTGGQTTSGQPTSDSAPTTSNGGSDSQGTDSAATTANSSPSTSGGPSDPSATAADTTTGDVTATGTGADTGSTGEPPPMCMEADCPMGQFCNGGSGLCEPGCNEDLDCMGGTVCDVDANQCIGCLVDANCGLGTVCDKGTKACVPGCNMMQPCQDGLACCGDQCFDLLNDVLHCGSCDPCPVPDNAAAACTMGVCGLGACVGDFSNCDKDPGNGCEVDGSCECNPGEQVGCYTGPDGTQNKGICKGGLQTCNPQGTAFGPCQGEVLPKQTDICTNNLDDDCDGVTDEDPDEDGDGWTVCKGDCCDAVGPACQNPLLVNPGAFEFPGNMVDDDCDGIKDNPVPACDQGLASNSNTPTDYAKAIDLCQFTVENPPLPTKKWGVISAGLFRGNGAGNPDAAAKSIRPKFGTGGIVPQQNNSLAVFSTGNAAAVADLNPPYADFQTGKDNAANSAAPADWLGLNGNVFPNAPGCPAAGSNQAYNSVMLKIRVRVPTNAKSFNVQMYFMSSEWPEWTCTPYNDMFVTLLDSTGVNPKILDKNIAVYTLNNQIYPVGVNLVKAAPGLFTQCKNGTYGCAGVNGGNYNGCLGTGQLTGTGMDILEGGCGANNTTGGGTNWLKMAGNVTGGETMEIRFVIWDTSDGIYDSLVLLDDWVWSVQASQPGVQPN